MPVVFAFISSACPAGVGPLLRRPATSGRSASRRSSTGRSAARTARRPRRVEARSRVQRRVVGRRSRRRVGRSPTAPRPTAREPASGEVRKREADRQGRGDAGGHGQAEWGGRWETGQQDGPRSGQGRCQRFEERRRAVASGRWRSEQPEAEAIDGVGPDNRTDRRRGSRRRTRRARCACRGRRGRGPRGAEGGIPRTVRRQRGAGPRPAEADLPGEAAGPSPGTEQGWRRPAPRRRRPSQGARRIPTRTREAGPYGRA